MRSVNSSKLARLVDVRKPVRPMNSNKIVSTVTSDKPANSDVVRLVNSSKPVCSVNSSKTERLVDVRKSVRPPNSNKPVYPVNVCKSVVPVDVCKPVCLADIRKLFLVDYWRHVSLFLILLLFAVSINTSAFNRTILYIILFISIHMTFLIFTKFFKCTFVILTGNFLYIRDRLFKYSFLWIFIICKYVFKLLLITLFEIYFFLIYLI